MFQTKAPLSVGYKAVLVHEFARPPMFALRSKIRNEFSASLVYEGRRPYPLIPYLFETFMSWFIFVRTFADCSHDFSLSYLGHFALDPLHENPLTFFSLGHLLLLEKFYISLC